MSVGLTYFAFVLYKGKVEPNRNKNKQADKRTVSYPDPPPKYNHPKPKPGKCLSLKIHLNKLELLFGGVNIMNYNFILFTVEGQHKTNEDVAVTEL